MKPALLVLMLLLQDDPAQWLERLRSDDVRERDAATRKLESLGLQVVEGLQPLAGGDLEVRARLREIVATLKKRAEMAKVFGPTKRVTASFKQRKLGEVLAELKKALDEPIEGEKLDPERLVDLELKGATLWEALDALGRAAGARIEYGYTQVTVLPGTRVELPSRNVEQFRIAVGELKRMEHVAPGRSAQVGLITLSLGYQRNLKPVIDHFGKAIEIDSVVDAGGRDVRVERVDWGNSWSMGGNPFTLLHSFMVAPDAGALTVEGRTRIPFEVKCKELSVPMAEGKRKANHDGIDVEVQEVVSLPTGLSLKLELEWKGEDQSDRLKDQEVRIIDSQGKSHVGSTRGGGKSDSHRSIDLVFPAGIEKPDRLVYSWITEFHLVEIPFRFEGLKIP